MTVKVSTATGTVWPLVCSMQCLPKQDIFIVRNICKTCVRYFFGSFTLQLFILPGEMTTCMER